MNRKIFSTPLGWAGVVVSNKGIIRIVLPKTSRRAVERELADAERKAGQPDRSAKRQLNKAVMLLRKYFSGRNVRFDLPLDLRYYTDFQQTVWRACRQIPFGQSRSYGWLAQKIKRPGAARAVGQAMGANPVPVIIP